MVLIFTWYFELDIRVLDKEIIQLKFQGEKKYSGNYALVSNASLNKQVVIKCRQLPRYYKFSHFLYERMENLTFHKLVKTDTA